MVPLLHRYSELALGRQLDLRLPLIGFGRGYYYDIDISLVTQKTDPSIPPSTRTKRSVRKVSSDSDVAESIFSLGFTQFHGVPWRLLLCAGPHRGLRAFFLGEEV